VGVGAGVEGVMGIGEREVGKGEGVEGGGVEGPGGWEGGGVFCCVFFLYVSRWTCREIEGRGRPAQQLPMT